MHQIDLQVQLLAQLHVEALRAGVVLGEGREERALQADPVSPDGFQDLWREVCVGLPIGVTA